MHAFNPSTQKVEEVEAGGLGDQSNFLLYSKFKISWNTLDPNLKSADSGQLCLFFVCFIFLFLETVSYCVVQTIL